MWNPERGVNSACTHYRDRWRSEESFLGLKYKIVDAALA